MIKTALNYKAAGLSVIGCTDKRPVASSWIEYQTNIATDDDLNIMFKDRKAPQIAVICGAISGNLELIDIDDVDIVDEVWTAIVDLFDGQAPPLTFVKTQSGGAHIYYRCETIEGNLKLARKPIPNSKKIDVRIETRGEGGYAIAPPSPCYKLMHGDILNIKTIDADTRDDILDICRSYNLYFPKASAPKKITNIDPNEYRETPWDNYNADTSEPWEAILNSHGWERVPNLDTSERQFWKRPGTKNKTSANWHLSKRIFFVHSSSTILDSDKGHTPFSILAHYEHDGDFSEAAKHLIKNGYGTSFSPIERKLIDKCVLDMAGGTLFEKLESINFDDFSVLAEPIKAKVLDVVKATVEQKSLIFWSFNKQGNPVIQKNLLVNFLTHAGVYAVSQDRTSSSFKVVLIDKEKHIIKEIGQGKGIIEVLKDELDKINYKSLGVRKQDIINMLMSLSLTQWTTIATWLPTMTLDELNILRDDKDNIYHFFKNGYVHITKNETNLLQYETLNDDVLIWADSINPHKIEPVDFTHEQDFNKCDFYRFIKRLSGVPKKEDGTEYDLKDLSYEDSSKYIAFITTLGYLLTNYKDPSKPFAVVVAEDTAEQEKGGGTGKSLLIKAIRQLARVAILQGKEWKPDKSFAYQTVSLGTDIMCIEDTTRYFSFERIYNLITEGLVIEKKNKDALTLDYEVSPKIAITTNYDISGDGNHAKRRMRKILVSRYFCSDHSPLDEYSNRFFQDWDALDWNWFYNSLFFYAANYLKLDIQAFNETLNMKIKGIKTKYGDDFFSYMWNKVRVLGGETALIKDLFNDFKEEYQPSPKSWSGPRFSLALKYFCEKLGFEMVKETVTNRENQNRRSVSFKGNFEVLETEI